MSLILKQPMANKYCLSCKGCCRFKEKNSLWRPKVYLNEEEIFGKKVLGGDVLDDKRCVKAKLINGQHFCALLDIKTNKCTAYPSRPLECQLYPFLFVKRQGTVFLAIHLACPFVQEAKATEAFKEYCHYLERFFKQEKVNPVRDTGRQRFPGNHGRLGRPISNGVKEFLKKSVRHISSNHILQDETEIIFPILSS